MRKFSESELLIASGNKGKVKEIIELLADFNVKIRSLDEFSNIEEPEETGLTFKENAILKAKYYGEITGLPALADDSGLAIDALNGDPGIYSARWAGETKDFSIAMNKVENELKSSNSPPPYSAHFVCALAIYWPDGHIECVEGKAYGNLTFPARGEKGFGYDPIFIPEGYNKTFAEIEPDIKKNISHRSDAFKKIVNKCFA